MGLNMLISAYPEEGYVFSSWSGDVPEANKFDNPLSLLMDSDKRIQPVFNFVTGIETSDSPYKYALESNFPNPFNPVTKIQFSLKEACFVNIIIYNILGKEVCTLISKPMKKGNHCCLWDGSNNAGKQVSTGVYFYKLSTNEFKKTKKMLFIQ